MKLPESIALQNNYEYTVYYKLQAISHTKNYY